MSITLPIEILPYLGYIGGISLITGRLYASINAVRQDAQAEGAIAVIITYIALIQLLDSPCKPLLAVGMPFGLLVFSVMARTGWILPEPIRKHAKAGAGLIETINIIAFLLFGVVYSLQVESEKATPEGYRVIYRIQN